MTNLPEQSRSIAKKLRKYGIAGIAIHLAGFALGFISTGLVLMGAVGVESGVAVLAPLGEVLYITGLVMVVAVAYKAGVPMKYLVVAGAALGLASFYVEAPHEIHVASGIGFGLPHQIHRGLLGSIPYTIIVSILVALMLVYTQPGKQREALQ